MTPWDNWTVDGLLWAAAITALVVVLIKWGPRLVNRDDTFDLHPPVSEPIRHVRIDANGRVHKVGVDVHSGACAAGHKIECVCGLGETA